MLERLIRLIEFQSRIARYRVSLGYEYQTALQHPEQAKAIFAKWQSNSR